MKLFLIKLVNETSVTRCYGLEVIDDLLLRILEKKHLISNTDGKSFHFCSFH